MNLDFINPFLETAEAWFFNNVLVWQNLIELVVIILMMGVSYLGESRLRKGLSSLLVRLKWIERKQFIKIRDLLLRPLIFLIGLWLYIILALGFSWPSIIVRAVSNLVTAWILIRLISSFMKNKFWARILSIFIWGIVAFKILNIYEQTITVFDNIAFASGNINLSLLTLIKAGILLAVFYWGIKNLTVFVERKMEKTSGLEPSHKVLMTKILKIAMLVFAVFFTMSSLGIDLSTFAFLGGAVAVGVGFGLQKIVSNFISGIIILMDKSIKPGDVIEIDEIYGWVKQLGSRFASIVTRDGKEYLVPNENFITEKVVNWSYSDEYIRINVPVGISYKNDPKQAREIMLEIAEDTDRVKKDPAPVCLLKEFGSSSVDLELRFWINDPRNGIANVRSNILFSIWDAFKEHEIGIPFPQQDLHVKSLPEELDLKSYIEEKKQNFREDAADGDEGQEQE